MNTKYITPISTGFIKEGAKNDCTIRAVVNATGKSYEEVLMWVLLNTKYKIGKGLFTDDVLSLFDAHGLKFLGAIGTTKAAQFFKKHSGSNLEVKGATIGKILDMNPKGTYVVAIKGHAFCIKDAMIVDNVSSLNRNLRCTAIWKYEVN